MHARLHGPVVGRLAADDRGAARRAGARGLHRGRSAAAATRALEAEVEPVDGIADALDRIDHEFCVASSGAPEKIRLTLGTTGLLERFEERIFSAVEVERGKPHPDLFLHAARTMGHQPERCAVVEDTTVGVEAARAAGMRAFGYAALVDSPLLEAAGATATFTAMADLPGLLTDTESLI